MFHLGVVGRYHLVCAVFHTHTAYAFSTLLTSFLFNVAFLSDKSSTSVCIHFDRVALTCSYFDVTSVRLIYLSAHQQYLRWGGYTNAGQQGGCAPQLGPSPGTNQLPIRPKIVKIKSQQYFFKLRSILMLPGLEISIKSEIITKK